MGKHLNLSDRITIEIQLKRWSRQSEIAKALKRSKSSISREISNNSIKKKWSNKIELLAYKLFYKFWNSIF